MMLQQYKYVFHGKHRKYIREKAAFKLILKGSLEFFRKGE